MMTCKPMDKKTKERILAEVEQELSELKSKIEHGFQGGCWCCESVAENNIRLAAEQRTCKWTKTVMNNYGEYDCWATQCGEDFAIEEEWHETPTKFCSNCGGKTIDTTTTTAPGKGSSGDTEI